MQSNELGEEKKTKNKKNRRYNVNDRLTGIENKATELYAWTPAEKNSSQRFLDDKVVAKTNHK